MGSLFRPCWVARRWRRLLSRGGATGGPGYRAVTWLDWPEATLVPVALMATTVNR